MKTKTVFGLLAMCGALASCGDAEPVQPTAETGSDELIYGADDRLEMYEVVDPVMRQVADSTAVMLGSAALTPIAGGYRIDTSTTAAQYYGLCSSEPYSNQPAPGDCSAFQVGSNLIATAGHCVTAFSCGSTAFAFGFQMLDPNTVRANVPDDDVYFCQTVIARTETSTDDWAVVRVDRDIVGHGVLPIRRAGSVSLGSPLAVAGYPMGLPLKVAGGATVKANGHSNYFQSNLDVYGGNSGSPVFALDGVVEGILVRGNDDFVSVGKGRRRCLASRVCPDSGCPSWEEVSRTTRFAQHVPEGPGCQADADCDDADPCNGEETCAAGDCSAGTPPDCDDGDACTDDACRAIDAVQFVCDNTATDCGNDPCRVYFCDPGTGCGSDPVQCGGGEICVEGDCVQEPVCSAKGAACVDNAECCSNNCHHRKRTCR